MRISFLLREVRANWTLIVLFLTALVASARANVYATNVRLNGSSTDAALYVPCGQVMISYLLNEPATAGVTIDILQGETVVFSQFFAGGERGTGRGQNAFVWDGLDATHTLVPLTNYTVRITAAALGHDEWTQISDDLNPGNYAWDPTSIAVNRNTNSPDYGSVFLANASPGPNPSFNLGDLVGLLKLNADGSRASDVAFSTGGWAWSGDGTGPGKLEISADDQLYVHDGSGDVVLRFDQRISSASRLEVWRPDNQPSGSNHHFTGFSVTGSGTNFWLTMADASLTNSLGIRRWPIGPDGRVAPAELGLTTIEAGTNSDLTGAPYDVALDASNRTYTIQYREASGDPAHRVLCFPVYTNVAPALTNAEWKVGSGNNYMRGASGVAVSHDGHYLAVAFAGALVNGTWRDGRTTVFDTATGGVVTNLVTDLSGGESHSHLDVAWDNAGNLYDVDHYEGLWRVYSPPGSNAAVTIALAPLRVTEPPTNAILAAVSHTGNQFNLNLTGRTNLSYLIQSSTNLNDWTTIATNAPESCSTRSVSVPAPGERNFYRATAVLPSL